MKKKGMKRATLLRYLDAVEELIQQGKYAIRFEDILATAYGWKPKEIDGYMVGLLKKNKKQLYSALKERGLLPLWLSDFFFALQKSKRLSTLDPSEAKYCTNNCFRTSAGIGFIMREDDSIVGTALRLVALTSKKLRGAIARGHRWSNEKEVAALINDDAMLLDQAEPILRDHYEMSPPLLDAVKSRRPNAHQVDVRRLLGK